VQVLIAPDLGERLQVSHSKVSEDDRDARRQQVPYNENDEHARTERSSGHNLAYYLGALEIAKAGKRPGFPRSDSQLEQAIRDN
jgi:hypothetical protein